MTTLLVDTREQWTQFRPGRRPDTHISDYLERHGIPWKIQKLDVGDYMLEGGSITVDRKKDLEEIGKDGEIEIKCEFCSKVYRFDQNDIRTVLNYVSDKR